MKDISRPIIKTVLIPADSTGCSHYRMIFPAMVIKSMFKDILYIETYKFSIDFLFFPKINQIIGMVLIFRIFIKLLNLTFPT